MKKLLYLLLAFALFSCKDEKKDFKKPTAEIHEIRTDLYGSWVGEFEIEERDTTREAKEETNKINILIKRITPTEVIGQSIVAGNNRILKGQMIETGNSIQFTLKEPGDDKNDGVFNFEIKNDTILTGTWTAYNSKKEVTKRKYVLTKKQFKYDPTVMLPEEQMYVDYVNPKKAEIEITEDSTKTESGENEYDESDFNEYVYREASEVIYTLNSSTKKLKESDLKNLKKLDLQILRNTIFARHGLTFKTKTVRQFFDYVDWYIPISSNVDNELSTTEKENIAVLKRFEKYAEDNYDSFGR